MYWFPRQRPSPQKEAWKPRMDRGPDRTVPVARRFRDVRLRRRRRAAMSGTSVSGWIVICSILGAVAIFAYRAIAGV